MNAAALRAATRRGSSITIRRPCSHGAPSSASGTWVVLPAPGGASSTRRGCVARLPPMAGSSGLIGNAAGSIGKGYGPGARPPTPVWRVGAGPASYNEAPTPAFSDMHLVDIGANLTHESFDHDLDAVLQRARDAGVAQMVVTGASREHSPRALELARRHPGVLYATAGVHPHHATEYTDECDAEMRALQAHPEVVAVGECGL